MRLAWIVVLGALAACEDKQREKECEAICRKVEDPALAECRAKFPERDGGVPTAEEVEISFARTKCNIEVRSQAVDCFMQCLKR